MISEYAKPLKVIRFYFNSKIYRQKPLMKQKKGNIKKKKNLFSYIIEFKSYEKLKFLKNRRRICE